MHRHELGAAPDRPERDVHRAIAQVVPAIADHDRPDAAGPERVDRLRRQDDLTIELPQCVGR